MKLPGASIMVLAGMKVLQAAPESQLVRSATGRFRLPFGFKVVSQLFLGDGFMHAASSINRGRWTFSLLSVILCSPPVQAGYIIQMGRAEAQWPPFTRVSDFTFDLFDPLDRELNVVRLTWTLRVETLLQFTNPHDTPAVLNPMQRTFVSHGPRLLSDISGGALFDLINTDERVLAPHETITIEGTRLFAGYSLDITNPTTLELFLGTGTADWGIYDINPQRENRLNGVVITPDALAITAIIDMSIEYNQPIGSTAVPAPATLVLGSIGALGGIGYWSLRRRILRSSLGD